MGDTPRLVPFCADHLLAFSSPLMTVPERIYLVRWIEKGGPAFTGIWGEEIIGCGGVFLHWRGMGEAWFSVSSSASRHRLWFTRIVRRILPDIATGLSLHRLQAVVRADRPDHQRWVELVGFRQEHILKKYGPDGSDYLRYVIFPNLDNARVPVVDEQEQRSRDG